LLTPVNPKTGAKTDTKTGTKKVIATRRPRAVLNDVRPCSFYRSHRFIISKVQPNAVGFSSNGKIE
jgi:hypothetical protein